MVNTDYISGKELEMLSLVKGSTIQSKHLGKDIAQAFKAMVGGELKAYNEMMNEARALATKRMVAEAEALGADAIVNIRYASSAIMQSAAEVIAYGTAVWFVNKKKARLWRSFPPGTVGMFPRKRGNSPPARQSRAIRMKIRGAAAPPIPPHRVYRQSESSVQTQKPDRCFSFLD